MKKLLLVLMLIVGAIAGEEYVLDNRSSNIYFKATSDVLFFGNDEIIGVSRDLEGQVVKNTNSIKGVIVANSKSFDTQNRKRDMHIKEILNAYKYPEITFKILKELETEEGVVLDGTLTINGIEKDTKFLVKKSMNNNSLIYIGKTSIKYRDFNIEPPTLAGVIKQAKETLEIGGKIVLKRVDNAL